MTPIQQWFITFFEEKNLDLSPMTRVKDGYLQLGDVASAILSAPYHEQVEIRNVLIKIDFKNGDVTDYLRHLAKALSVKNSINYQE